MPPPALPPWRDDPAKVRPMAATLADRPAEELLQNRRWIYEKKYDGIRALVSVEPAHPSAIVRIWSRNGHDKTKQFPELERDFKQFGRSLKAPVLLDGEIVALDERGRFASFGRIQPRLHVQSLRDIHALTAERPVVFIAFDLLRDGGSDLRGLPLSERRVRLERVFGNEATSLVQHGDYAAGDGRRLYAEAEADEAEGLVAKLADSRYESGRRSPAWLKIKITRRQEFVVGGWTAPRQSRMHFGALLLGVYDPPDEPGTRPSTSRKRDLVFVGQVGSGFTDAELARVAAKLKPLGTDMCPFTRRIEDRARSQWSRLEPARWVKPELVAEVKYSEWTEDGFLRHPVYLGLRDDKPAAEVGREGRDGGEDKESRRSPGSARRVAASSGSTSQKRAGKGRRSPGLKLTPELERLADRLHELEDAGKDGVVEVDGRRLDVSNLRKVFWPGPGLTKGDLLRYYVRVSPFLLPVIADRALVMKRYPDGVKGKAFYQHRPPDQVAAGVRVALVPERSDEIDGSKPMFIGGSLLTLLYMTQLAAISQDPWFSRVETPADADHLAFDLDPMPGVPFAQVLDVARWLRDELEAMEVPAFPKTSGSSGLHVYVPLPSGTPYEIGQMFGRLVATVVSAKHPKAATVERQVTRRGRKVYVDFLQNIQGKTLATAYSARASEFAGVSTPLAWDEVDAGIAPEDFHLQNAIERFTEIGDLWAGLLTGPPVDLHAALERLAAQMG